MRKTKLTAAVLAAAALMTALLAQAGSDRKVQHIDSHPKPHPGITAAERSSPQKAPLSAFRQGYQLVTDVIDGFGGKSESDNYRIPVNSGGQPSPIGPSESASYAVKAGYAYASYARRGDPNADGAIGAGDIVYLIGYLYRSGPEPVPMEAGDANCDGAVGAGDIVYLIGYLYRGGPPPAC